VLKRALNVQQTGPATFRLGRVEFDKQQRTVTLPALVHLRGQVVEYVLVTESGKAYESLLTTDAKPADVQLAFLLLGMSPVAVGGDFNQAAAVPASNAVAIEVTWEKDGRTVKHPLAELILLTTETRPDEAPRPFALRAWFYNGSFSDSLGFVAQREGSLVSLIRDPAALVNNPRADRDNHHIHFPNDKRLPAEDTPVRVILRLPARAGAPAPPKAPPEQRRSPP